MGKLAAHQTHTGPERPDIPPAGSRYCLDEDGNWIAGIERLLSTGPLGIAVTKLTSSLTPKTPAEGLNQLRAIGEIRSMLDGLESLVLADTSELVQRGLPTPLSTENPTLFDYKQEIESHGYPISRMDQELNRSSFVAEAAMVSRSSERATFNKLTTAEGLRYVHEDSLFELCRGAITGRTAGTLVKQTRDIPLATAKQIEASMLPAAFTSSDAAMALRIKRQRERLHPEPAAHRRARAEGGRSLMWWPEADGMAILQAYLPAEDILSIYNTVNAHAGKLLASEEVRRAGQLRADVFRDSLIDGWPATKKRNSALFVGLTIPALELLTSPERGIANLEGYGPIPLGAALKLAAKAPSLKAILTDPWTGSILDLGRKRYKPSKALRDFLRVRDEHCRFPGCRRAPIASEIDHIEAWAKGGKTNEQNAEYLCKRHQVYKHVLGWDAVYLGNGSIQWRTPHGVTQLELPDGLVYSRGLDPIQRTDQEMLPIDHLDPQTRRLLGWGEHEAIPGFPENEPDPSE